MKVGDFFKETGAGSCDLKDFTLKLITALEGEARELVERGAGLEEWREYFDWRRKFIARALTVFCLKCNCPALLRIQLYQYLENEFSAEFMLSTLLMLAGSKKSAEEDKEDESFWLKMHCRKLFKEKLRIEEPSLKELAEDIIYAYDSNFEMAWKEGDNEEREWFLKWAYEFIVDELSIYCLLCENCPGELKEKLIKAILTEDSSELYDYVYKIAS